MNIHPLSWIKAHPYKAIGWTALLSTVAGCAAGIIRSGALLPFLAIFLPFVAVWLVSVWWDCRKMSALLLAGLFLLPTNPPKAKAGVVVGVVVVTVVVVGGYVIYKLNKFCQRYFSPQPDPTNAPPELSFDGAINSAGATCSFSPLGSCYVPGFTVAADLFSDTPETPFRLEMVVSGDGRPNIALSEIEQVAQVDWNTWQSQLAGWGLTVSDAGGWADSYSVNGLPVFPDQCPISFDAEGTVTVDLGGPLHLVTVEASHDLISWETILATRVPANVPFVITHTSDQGMTIYRVSAQ
jgi:hypothetical protein